MGYFFNVLSDRVVMFVDFGVEVYEGMIIGMNFRKDDMVVNFCKNKKMSNVCVFGLDDVIKLFFFRIFIFEEVLEFIEDDELVEIIFDFIRFRKRFLNEYDRLRYNKFR